MVFTNYVILKYTIRAPYRITSLKEIFMKRNLLYHCRPRFTPEEIIDLPLSKVSVYHTQITIKEVNTFFEYHDPLAGLKDNQ